MEGKVVRFFDDKFLIESQGKFIQVNLFQTDNIKVGDVVFLDENDIWRSGLQDNDCKT